MIRMTLANWERFEVASKRIDPDTGQRYVRLSANARETWEKVEIAWLDSRFSSRHLETPEYLSPVSSHR